MMCLSSSTSSIFSVIPNGQIYATSGSTGKLSMKQLAKTLFILCRTAPLLNRFGASCFPHTNDPDFLVMDCLNFDVTDGNFKEAVGGL
jgi:hypothetical protein